ncbi:MAG TPA: RES family NAD+ phosphorylase [Terriglobales bacterium]|nr:RES family NAD+ phosphorylase [Terriglobales bacterium]
MPGLLPVVSPHQPVYRIGRQPDPWSPPDWSRALPDRTFGNRFDDSAGQFRVLYAGSSRLACFMETLAPFRKAPNLEAQLAAISDNEVEPDLVIGGTVPASWLSIRRMGMASVGGQRFADIYSSEWLAYLRPRFEVELIDRGVIEAGSDFDLSLIMRKDRSLTQRIATLVYSLEYDGIFYLSRYGNDLLNWAIFEPFDLEEQASSEIQIDDPDFREALRRLNLQLDPHH